MFKHILQQSATSFQRSTQTQQLSYKRILTFTSITLSSTTMSTQSSSNGNVDYKSLTNDQWKQRLTPEQFNILRLKGTGMYNTT